MTPLELQSIYQKRRNYTFLLALLLIVIVVISIINPGGIVTTYLPATIFIIIFFLAFIISVLFLYNRDPSDLTPLSIPIDNLFFKSLIALTHVGLYIAFACWIAAAFNATTFNEIFYNKDGLTIAIIGNYILLTAIFLMSIINFGQTRMIITGIISAFLIVMYFCVTFFVEKNSYNINNISKIKYPILIFYSLISIGILFLFNNSKNFTIQTTNEQIMTSYFLKTLMFLVGGGISAAFIYWIVTLISHFDSKTSIIAFIINALIVVTILGLVFKAIIAFKIFGSSPLINLIINILLYIPCIFVNIIELIVNPFGGFHGSVLPAFSLKQEYQNTTRGSVIMLVISILLITLYFSYPHIKNKSVLQGGKQLLNEPMYLNTERVIGSYGTLNNSDVFNYQYAISFWFYIDSSSPSTNASYLKYTSLLNYGNKPNVMYNAKLNILRVVMDQTGGPPSTCTDLKITHEEFDENGMRIIYKNKDVLLQKWNNMIINYTGGTLDIFLNGELVKSAVQVIPYMKLDNLSVGQNNGLNGGTCNVIYFKTPLNATQIYYIYNSVKNKTPPTLYE